MADRKISEFATIAAAEMAGDDLVPVVDVSAGSTAAGNKRATVDELRIAMRGDLPASLAAETLARIAGDAALDASKANLTDLTPLANRLSVIEGPGWATEERMGNAAVSPRTLSPAVLDMFNGAGYAGLWSPASAFPGGSLAGQVWLVTAAGSRGGQAFTVGDRLVSLVNGASTTVYAGNWMRVQQWETISSLTDTTPGRLVTPGAYGWGLNNASLNVPDGNANTLNTNGAYRAASSVTGNPVGALAQVLHLGQSENVAAQIWALTTGTPGDAGRYPAAVRYRGTDGVWRAAEALLGRLNIVGTVSRAGGLPTGAIIERGSNANGDYIRWADGTQICWQLSDVLTGSTASGTLFLSNVHSWTFPAAFNAAPIVQASARRDAGAHGHFTTISSGPLGSSGVSLYMVTTTSGATGRLHNMAIGRWSS